MINNEQAKIDAVLDVSKVSYLQSTMFPVTIQTYARDLLEARELIKEMRDAVGNLLDGKNRVFECSCEAEDFDELEAKTGKAYLLWERLKMAFEKSKEYAV